MIVSEGSISKDLAHEAPLPGPDAAHTGPATELHNSDYFKTLILAFNLPYPTFIYTL